MPLPSYITYQAAGAAMADSCSVPLQYSVTYAPYSGYVDPLQFPAAQVTPPPTPPPRQQAHLPQLQRRNSVDGLQLLMDAAALQGEGTAEEKTYFSL